VTEIYQDSNLGASKLKQQSSHKKAFTEVLMSELYNILPYSFGIDVELDFNHPIKKADFGSLAVNIAKICYTELEELVGNYSSKEFEEYYFGLPQGIKSIRITRIEGLNEPHNFQSEAGVVPVLTNAHLHHIISKKEQSLMKFHPCDEYWLIIREGNYHSGSFGRVPKLELPIKSTFSKIFLIRTNYRELLLLK
jgi:hypothetical protein